MSNLQEPIDAMKVPGLRLLILLAFAMPGFADGLPYRGVEEFHVSRGELRLQHRHDWAKRAADIGQEPSLLAIEPLCEQNDFSRLELIDTSSDRVLFSVPSPALSYLWISEDMQYFVGMSNLKLWNPIQVVVFDARGRALAARGIACDEVEINGCGESVSNWVHWYDEDSPNLELSPKADTMSLEFRGPKGDSATVDIPRLAGSSGCTGGSGSHR